MNILDILKRYTDENHRLSQKDIQDILEREYDMTVERKAVKRNLMNLIEFAVVPHLLLWGRWNMIFALLLGVFILVNAFPRFPRTHA